MLLYNHFLLSIMEYKGVTSQQFFSFYEEGKSRDVEECWTLSVHFCSFNLVENARLLLCQKLLQKYSKKWKSLNLNVLFHIAHCTKSKKGTSCITYHIEVWDCKWAKQIFKKKKSPVIHLRLGIMSFSSFCLDLNCSK